MYKNHLTKLIMSIPYTYLIKHIPTGLVYYGVRYAQNCKPDDLWVSYFTSSKKVKALIKQTSKDSFAFEVRRTFSDVDKAREWEHKVLRRLNVVRRKDFLNMTNGKSLPPRYGPRSEETKRKMSKPRNAKFGPVSDERKLKVSEALKGRPRSEETKNRISKSNLGKTKSLEHRKKISDAIKAKHNERKLKECTLVH
jgi:hypothetical protein